MISIVIITVLVQNGCVKGRETNILKWFSGSVLKVGASVYQLVLNVVR